MAVEKLFEVPTRDILHSHKVLLTDFSQVVGLYNIGVDQVGHEFGFANKIISKFLNSRVLLAD